MRLLLILILMLYLVTESFGGVYRWFSVELGFIELVYLPKLAVLFSLFIVLLLKKHHVSKWLILIIIFCWCCLGVVSNGLEQSVFALFMVSPLFVFYLVDVAPRESPNSLYSLMLILFIFTVSGIFYDYFYDVPWTGTMLETSYGELENSREWWTQGITRSAGFTRDSTTAAMLTALLAINLMTLKSGAGRKIMLYMLTIAALVCTTSKATIVGFVLVSPLLFFSPTALIRSLYLLAMIASQIIVMSLIGFVSTSDFLRPTSTIETLIYGSFYTRLSETWPGYISDIINNSGLDQLAVIFGGGLGSTGAPQKLFTGVPVLADSSILYLWGTFGLMGFVFWGLILNSIKVGLMRADPFYFGIAVSGIFLMFLSLTTDIWESVFALVIIGINIGSFGTKVESNTVSPNSLKSQII